MTGASDGTSPGWDATAPVSGWDPLAVTAGDALPAAYTAPSAYTAPFPDALATGYAGDALAAGDAPATADPRAAPVLGDAFADSLTTYGDATAADGPDRRGADRRAPRPGPVPPVTADDRPTEVTGRARTGPADAARQRPGGPAPSSRRTSRPATRGSGAATARTGRPAAGPAAATGRTARPPAGSAAGTGRPGSSAGRPGSAGTGSAGGRSRGGQPGAGSAPGGGRTGTGGSVAGRRGATWEDLTRMGPPPGGQPAGSGQSYGGPPPDPPPPRGRGSAPPWQDRPSRPTGTVPWVGGSGRSGWDDFFAGAGGTSDGSGTQPSSAEVARAMLDALRRNRRPR